MSFLYIREPFSNLMKANPDTTGKLEGKFKVSLEKMISLLNEIVQAEYSQWFRYYHYSLVLRGHCRDALAEEFENHAEEELGHAERIAMRVIGLGGYPSTDMIHPEPIKDTEEIVKELLRREQEGIQLYKKVLAQCGDNEGTRQVLESNIEIEQEHVDDLWRFLKHPELIKAALSSPANKETAISGKQGKREYDSSFSRQYTGVGNAETPDKPEVGKDWHGTVPGVKDEPQELADGTVDDSKEDKEIPLVWGDSKVPFESDEKITTKKEKSFTSKLNSLHKSTASAIQLFGQIPNFEPKAMFTPYEKDWLLTKGYSEKSIDSGTVRFNKILRSEYTQWVQGTIKKSISNLVK